MEEGRRREDKTVALRSSVAFSSLLPVAAIRASTHVFKFGRKARSWAKEGEGAMLLRLAWFATLSGASAFLALPNARCYESVAAAARPATKKRATPALFQSTPAGPAPVIKYSSTSPTITRPTV